MPRWVEGVVVRVVIAVGVEASITAGLVIAPLIEVAIGLVIHTIHQDIMAEEGQ